MRVICKNHSGLRPRKDPSVVEVRTYFVCIVCTKGYNFLFGTAMALPQLGHLAPQVLDDGTWNSSESRVIETSLPPFLVATISKKTVQSSPSIRYTSHRGPVSNDRTSQRFNHQLRTKTSFHHLHFCRRHWEIAPPPLSKPTCHSPVSQEEQSSIVNRLPDNNVG
ncbi:hypothetical protein ACRALDRAFT_1095024 [Sodiomyces alcalophilus JCM 7366]|uniref:uncharacterized protein n=1 Tax=Sodiomyces alcalophilus JCM 7366 TaxID=591952 RepID=UPI0039B585F0